MGWGLLSWVTSITLLSVLQGCQWPILLTQSSPVIQNSPAVSQPSGTKSNSSQDIKKQAPQKSTANRTLQFLEQRSRSITVKVLADKTWGSGILIQRQGQRYLVLTNQHVVDSGKVLQIQTPDGRKHNVTQYPEVNFQGNDLALLQFNSSFSYPIASLGSANRLKVGNQVFAAGFPLNPKATTPQGFQFTQGRISLINPKAFEGGYQVGYTNAVVKGMSGGPLLNSQGIVVGVNGMQAYPLWGNPYVFIDGSTPPAKLQDQLTRSSWAIPVDTFLNLVPKYLRLAAADR